MCRFHVHDAENPRAVRAAAVCPLCKPPSRDQVRTWPETQEAVWGMMRAMPSASLRDLAAETLAALGWVDAMLVAKLVWEMEVALCRQWRPANGVPVEMGE